MSTKRLEGWVTKMVNILMLLFTIGSCVIIASLPESKDFYIDMLEKSQLEYKNQALFYLNAILNTPMSILMYIFILATVGKEFYLKSFFTKLKINTITAVLSLLLVLLMVFSFYYPIMGMSDTV